MRAADLGPVPPGERTQSALDLFLIFAGANIVATTLQAGAALAGTFGPAAGLGLIVAGSVAGSALVASLAPIGPWLGVPSVVAARAALGFRGASLVALLLYLTNFAWIALNNAIAASVVGAALDLRGGRPLLAVALGLAATFVVSRGPRAVGLADRVAVPLMCLVGLLLTWAVLGAPAPAPAPAPAGGGLAGAGWLSLLKGLDLVVGYQVSWILMFADYSRYTPSARRSAMAVFLALVVTSVWFMALGLAAARLAGSTDPGLMIAATGLHRLGALLVALATITTNFVNIYLSSLAWKSLFPRSGDQVSIWSIGIIGSALGVVSAALLERFADFMLALGGLLVPAGGVLLAHFFFHDRSTVVADLYDRRGPYGRHGGVSIPGVTAWAAGSLTYFLAAEVGSTLPSLVVSILTYLAAARALGK
jgi:purine-cytosine permease-like protein